MIAQNPNEKIAALKDEVLRLNEENKRLKDQVSFLVGHQTLAEGMRGERLISGLLDGSLTTHTESFDVELHNGVHLEVKTSKLNAPTKGLPTRRWAWGKIFGDHNAKKFDFLILVGESDNRYSAYYADPKSPYVFFVVPYDCVKNLTMKNSKVRGIQLTTNPKRATSAASPLFTDYQVSVQQLKDRFGL